MTSVSTQSTGSSSQHKQPSPLPVKLQGLLQHVRQDQSNVNAFSDLLLAATEYVQTGEAKQSHIYCSIGRPCDFELESCMLRIFSFRTKDQVEIWRNRILKAIYSNCLECYKGFLKAKDQLRKVYLDSFPPEKLDAFFAYFDSCEEQLALDLLEKARQSPGDPLKKLSRPEIYAVLSLTASPHATKLGALLRQVIKLEQLSNIQELPAGLLTLCIDEDATVRAFAARQMLLLKPLTKEMASLTIFSQAIARVVDQYSHSGATADWSLLSILLHAVPDAAPSLTSPILSHIHDRHQLFSDVLKAYATLLKLRGPSLWVDAGDGDEEYPIVILSGILDNPFFTNPLFESQQTVNNPRERGLFFGWMRLHLDSLKQDGGKQFGEAIKRIANFLFERMQQGHVPGECRAVALTEGIDLVLNHSDEFNSRQVVDLYASSIASIALRDDSKAEASTRRAAQQLISQAFERDSHNLCTAMEKLSEISVRNNQRWKARTKAARDASASKNPSKVPSADSIYEQASKEDYLSLDICHVLWSEVYSATGSSSSKEGIAIILGALAITAVFTPPSIQTHVLKQPAGDINPAYEAYLNRVRQSIGTVTKAFKAMRSDFVERLTDFGELAREDEVQELCTANAYSLLLLNLCPEPDVYRPAQNLLRLAFSSVETRSDCFRILFQINHPLSFRALADYLHAFVKATNTLIEANDLAKWMVRSFADIVNVLAGSTDGILRPGTSWTLIEDRSTLQAVALKAPAIWRLMCESVAAIFKRTPLWSTLLAREEMVAWFRDVTMFASEMVDALAVFRHVVRRAAEAPSRWTGKQRQEDGEDDLEPAEEEFMVQALALPIENATSWLRMNDEDILRETQSFILKALDQFGAEHELPKKAKDKMLNFINEQMSIKDADARHTLLSLDELADLKVRLDPDSGIIEISDEDNDAESTSSDTKVTQTTTDPAKKPFSSVSSKSSASSQGARYLSNLNSEPDNSHWWAGMGRLGLTSSQEKRRKMKQMKLSFSKVDPKDVIDIDGDTAGQPAKKPLTLDFTKPKPSPAMPSAPINAYKGATARTFSSASSSASRSGAAKGSTGKMAQLRQELGSSRNWRPQNVNVRSNDSKWGRNNEDEVIVKAPAAVSSVTGALINKMPAPSTEAAKAAARRAAGDSSESSSSSSESSESSDEDGTEAKGLAALRAKVDGPRTVRPAQPQRRQIKVLEDPHLARARRERADAERRRILRSPPDYAALHRSILAWNYFHAGDRPPAPSGKEPDYRRVLPHFGNASEYGSVFGPLLLLECWAQFQQAKEEADTSSDPSIPLEVAGRSTVDQFVDVNITIAPDLLPSNVNFSETDIVRLKERVPSISGKEPRMVLAKVEAFKRHPQGHQATLRCCLSEDRQGVNASLVNKSKWELKKLFSLTTLHREFAALMAAPYFDLFSDIVKARVAPKVTLSMEDVRKAMQGYQVNEPQARAILGSLSTEGFSLIQGPPGTGKTKTICALIGAFVSNRKGPSTSVQAGQTNGKLGASKKILLCAPSNAAIDEVAKRAKAGIRLLDGKMIFPKVVRVGRDDSINVSVKDISLEYLIEQRLGGGDGFDRAKGQGSGAVDPSALHAEVHSLKRQREEKQAELSNVRGNQALVTQLEAEIRNLSAKRLAVMSRLDEAKDKAQSDYRQREADRRRARMEILNDADVICTTLSGAGHEMLSGVAFDFETVVIDEAAQAVELSSIIPLRYGCKQCIMVGDPNQLPPTVISQQAERLGYSQSLFVRMFERSPAAVHLLSIQYRMHPEISRFPSRAFYDSKLQDGPGMAELTRQPWHKFELTRPFKFFTTKATESPGRLHSIMNREEANIALALYERLRLDYPSENFDYRIGIVTMYKAQVMELKRAFQTRYGYDILQRIDFNTVDGFQGQEKDIIILSCVRSSVEPRSIGFLSDRRRLNVAITRAKSNLFIIGNAEHLKRSDFLWSNLVTTAEQCGAIQPMTVSLLQRGDKTLAKNHANLPQSTSTVAKAPQTVAHTNGRAVDVGKSSLPAKPPPPGPPPARPPPPPNVSTPLKSAPAASVRPPTAAKVSPGGAHTNVSAPRPPMKEEKKRKSIIVRDDSPDQKRPRMAPNPSAQRMAGGVARPRYPLPAKVQPSSMRRPNGAGKPPASADPVGHISVGVLKRPPTPTGTSPNGAPSSRPPRPGQSGDGSPTLEASNRPRRPASPPKPSSAALNALFVKKRR